MSFIKKTFLELLETPDKFITFVHEVCSVRGAGAAIELIGRSPVLRAPGG